jgi:hypothetical protein
MVGPISTREAAAFVGRWHYSGGGGGNCICVGLYRGLVLVGVAAFGVPVSLDAAASVFGSEHHASVMDLQRFVLVDEAPRNSESWFLVRALRQLKLRRPQTWAVTSFADSTQGHRGVIYQATNAIYAGVAEARTAFIDQDGVLKSDRLDGHWVKIQDGIGRGWTPVRRGVKHRYLFLTPDNRRHRRRLQQMVRWESQPYPKAPAPPSVLPKAPAPPSVLPSAPPS